MMYKYRIYRQDGSCVEHCDPYGFGMELRPAFASIIRDLSHYKFKDSKWMQKRSVCKDKPLNIYELHFGSFKKPSKKADDWYTYVEMIDILIPYLKKMITIILRLCRSANIHVMNPGDIRTPDSSVRPPATELPNN